MFEQLALRLCLHRNEEFLLFKISQDHPTLQVPSRTFGSASLSFVLARTQYMNPQARLETATFKRSNTKIKTLGDQLLDHRFL